MSYTGTTNKYSKIVFLKNKSRWEKIYGAVLTYFRDRSHRVLQITLFPIFFEKWQKNYCLRKYQHVNIVNLKEELFYTYQV